MLIEHMRKRLAADRASCAVTGPEVNDAVPLQPERQTGEASGRLKRRWLVVLLRNKGEILGQVEATDVASAKAAAAIQFDLDEIQCNRIMVQELG
jgi:hypothetical protein